MLFRAVARRQRRLARGSSANPLVRSQSARGVPRDRTRGANMTAGIGAIWRSRAQPYLACLALFALSILPGRRTGAFAEEAIGASPSPPVAAAAGSPCVARFQQGRSGMINEEHGEHIGSLRNALGPTDQSRRGPACFSSFDPAGAILSIEVAQFGFASEQGAVIESINVDHTPDPLGFDENHRDINPTSTA